MLKTFVLALALLIVALLSFAADTNISGTYVGEWSSSGSGAGGAFRLTLASQPNGEYGLTVTFTLNNEEIKATTKSVRVEGDAIDAAYEFELQGYRLVSKIKGRRTGEKLEGKYESSEASSASPVDTGVWKASLKK